MGQGPFCACPVSLVSRLFFADVPGCAKWFLFVAPRWAPRPFGGARAKAKKKNTTQGAFFALAPCHSGTTANQFLETNDTGHEHKLGATTKTLVRPWTAMLTHFFSGATFPAGPGWCFFFAAAPRGLTHSLRGWAAMPPAGVVLLFCCGPTRTGVVFFFFLLCPRPDAHSLTVGWGDFGKARVVSFFAAAPPNPASQ